MRMNDERRRLLEHARRRMERAFADDTAIPGDLRRCPSSGHCTVVALYVQELFGGKLVSARPLGISHWFNRIDGDDIDLTGDQFGRAPLQVASEGTLYKETRVRNPDDLNDETRERYRLFRSRLGDWGSE